VTYDEAIEWLLSFADFERSGRFQDRPDVAPMLALLERLGNPHCNRAETYCPATVHVAGSKGKGSVAAMVHSALYGTVCACLYTSPHLYSYRERIRYDSTLIDEALFAWYVEDQLKPGVDEMLSEPDDRQLVTFDLLTALAFIAFRAHDTEVQVIETGLGGRVDSTNVFETKDVAAITPISLEHAAILGDTIEQITREKAAIIVPGCTVVMAPQPYETAEQVIREFARTVGAPVIDVLEDYTWERLSSDLRGQEIRIHSKHGAIAARLPVLGLHQIENAATAIASCDALNERWRDEYDREMFGYGLEHLQWPCRIEVVREDPLVIVDGAHNRDSARRLRETLVDYFACDRALFVIGCGSDKDIDGLAEELAPLAARVIAVRAEHPRAMAPKRIAEAFGRLNVDVEIVDNVPNAVDRALAATLDGSLTLICVAGSLFVAAEARAHVLGVRT
jgi:dihydrofolate synthase/folylpolyglutamate synthase